MKCVSKSHSEENCHVAKNANKKSNSRNDNDKNNLHVMITIMKVEEADRNEMNLDDQYLCSIQDLTRKDLILMMYNCKVNKLKKIALSDLEATMTYISSDYAKRFNVHFLEKSTSRIVQ